MDAPPPDVKKPSRCGRRAWGAALASREWDARQPFRPDVSRSGRRIRVKMTIGNKVMTFLV
jgi:hypothetical protein